MTEPTAPRLPADAPADVKAFFDCTSDRLDWRPGDVSWLGLPANPDVSFGAGPAPGAVTINVSLAGGLVGFSLPASVNAAGELVVDTSSVPDLSGLGLGGRQDVDAAIGNLNAWFRKNGKKLKPPVLVGGTVQLEKTPIAGSADTATTVPVVAPAPALADEPVRPADPAQKQPPATGGGFCSLLGMLFALLFVGVVAAGGWIGFNLVGALPATRPIAAVTPSATAAASPAPATPTARATATATPTVTASAPPSQSPTARPPASASPTAAPSPSPTTAAVTVDGVCVVVVHQALRSYLSYLDWYVYYSGEEIEFLEVVVRGANDNEAQRLEYDSESDALHGLLGLREPGNKRVVSALLQLSDGRLLDVTEGIVEALGGDSFRVRYPQEDTFGSCPR